MLLSVAHFQNDIYISVLVRTDSSMAGVVGFEPTECRSQSLLKCFIHFVIYCYIIPLKIALSQAFSPYYFI